ncbi:uncharacterized protein LACBIDRAFT_332407 [Laccaria bicolor S238N-H82]|uniref:Predicted protein n=1 Tax=Laccaria bicolor (strain S238N-H82 / ATCC MYA-4686) TaxID=486041 RepID=B0DSM0_LACBS|nr:uncharacterized protein LACBIDRAFT_332404 [Laccaria bicolor S238N-H82]XP_001887023.1 uncharacterized protein LACBIDRAFT_332407 [Laccaria bicolor S238N-H82]EDR02260.1 predicted protein [Laccaria bicolor S238N-H82]EDR02346.1 predicted protein [Laccaria bicolor S238N-H82]|eukprot:XP_001886937.1 predicted protein [Laccaria bicolor S238N-H82]
MALAPLRQNGAGASSSTWRWRLFVNMVLAPLSHKVRMRGPSKVNGPCSAPRRDIYMSYRSSKNCLSRVTLIKIHRPRSIFISLTTTWLRLSEGRPTIITCGVTSAGVS